MLQPKKISELETTDKDSLRNLGVGYNIVSVLPELIQPHMLTMHNGTIYRGLIEGESTLQAGTPVPLCGYWEYIAMLTQVGENNPIALIQKNTLGYTPLWERLSAGVYILPLQNTNMVQVFKDKVLVHYDIGQEDYGAWVRMDVAQTISLGTYVKLCIFTPAYNYFDWDKDDGDLNYSWYLPISFKVFPPKPI